MDKTYSPSDIESKWYENWENSGYFKPNYSEQADNYCIVIPPPNVTGSLHMGHAFQDTIMDCLIRYNRMLGKNTLWQAGTDHAGIATQIVVQNKIKNEENKTKQDYGREAFIDKIWQWKAESGSNISNQLRRIGASADWSRERFTMDDGLSNAVKEVFVRLYQEGLIYRGKRLVNWDPILKTAISDLEVVNHEEDGFMYYVRYPFVAGQGLDGKFMHIATTRPETILADGALAVHPSDERYKDVIGKMVNVPMTDRVIPIIVDEYPDPEFGSGCVKITPAHDFNDYQVGQRHEMEIINLFTPDAIMNEAAPQAYQGMDRFVARDAIVKDLETAGLLEKIEPHKLMRPRGDRTNSIIEPYLTDQWYVKTETLAKTAIEAVENGEIEFVPKQYENMYFSWMRDIQDWCISRQLWWGHRIPAWYDDKGNIYVGRDEAEVRAQYSLAANVILNQDEDVLDTWFSSALWTFSTLGWPEQTKELKLFHPTNVLVTGFDIIFFWVARMIMMTMHFIKDENGKPQVPFKTVYVTGLIRDENGDKMSKSKGNVLDPLDMIDGVDIESLVEKRTSNLMNPKQAEKIAKATRNAFPKGIEAHGTDALRFTLASLASTGRDINWDMNRLEGYRNFCNKLWNAARFVLMNIEDKDCGQNIAQTELKLRSEERWILSQCQKLNKETNDAFTQYRFDIAAQNMYHFTWDTYCSWYVELAKSGLNDENVDEDTKIAIRHTLLYVLDNILKIMHPLMPFITEEIWQQIKPMLGKSANNASIMLALYPDYNAQLVDLTAEKEITWLQSCLNGIRKIRSEMDIAPSKAISLMVQDANSVDKQYVSQFTNVLAKMAKVESITFADKDIPESAMTLIGEMKLHIPIAGLIDKSAELERLTREINKIQISVDRLNGQLNNKAYIDKAPANLVEQTKMQLVEQQQKLDDLCAQKDKISYLQ